MTGRMSDHFCYLRDSSLYVHEVAIQRHPLTSMKRRRFQDGPLTNVATQVWYLIRDIIAQL
jgi:hypothetical protein